MNPISLSCILSIMVYGHLRMQDSASNATFRLDNVSYHDASVASTNGSLPRDVHLLSFRSCSQNNSKPCNKRLFKELSTMSRKAAMNRAITKHHLFQGLPQEIFTAERWKNHVKDENIRGRGYWFWKVALFNYLVRNETIRDGDIVIYADPDGDNGSGTRYVTEFTEDKWLSRLDLFSDSSSSISDFTHSGRGGSKSHQCVG